MQQTTSGSCLVPMVKEAGVAGRLAALNRILILIKLYFYDAAIKTVERLVFRPEAALVLR
jgi:hypothetical protein